MIRDVIKVSSSVQVKLIKAEETPQKTVVQKFEEHLSRLKGGGSQ